MLWRKFRKAFKFAIYYLHYEIALKLLYWRNRAPKILKYPNRKLHEIAEPIDFEKISQKELVNIFRKLNAALLSQKYGERLGIAASQIGINKRIMIVEFVPMINPEWQSAKQTENYVESCYSLPKELYKTTRDKYGWASWNTISGERVKFKLTGIRAVVFQHELDHLNGTCCNKNGIKVEK
jgi:peptide deformylase